MGILKTVRNTALAVLLMAVLVVGAGMIYALFLQRITPAPDRIAAVDERQSRLLTPRPPNPDAPVGAAIEAISTTVKPGGTVSVIARTTPSALCKIVVDKFIATDSQPELTDQTADAYGTVSWSWTVDINASVGSRTARITCSYHGHSGVVQGNFRVEQ